MGAEEDAAKVEFDGVPPFVGVDLGDGADRGGAAATGVVDEYVDGSELVDRDSDSGLDLRLLCDVSADRYACAATARDVRCSAVDFVSRAGDDGDGGTFLCEGERGCSTDATAAAGDERNLAF